MKKGLISLFLLCFTFSTFAQSTFETDWNVWRKNREQGLVSWRNLTGLYWLENGRQTFGFSRDAAHVFPSHRQPAPDILGNWILANDVVLQQTEKGLDTLYQQGKSTMYRWESWEWFVIRRGDRWAIRARDTQHPDLIKPVEIPHFAVQPSWKIAGTWKPSQKKLTIVDITGQISQQPSAGTVTFQIEGKKYKLEALGSTTELFFVIGDLTNQNETYGGGRYLYSRVEPDGVVWLDFNRLTNPPCAFTPFATCPLPPKENKIKVALSAGEKRVHD